MFPHRDIHKYSRVSPDGKTHNEIDHILIDRWNSSTLDVRYFMESDCDKDHCLVVEKVWERFNFGKLNELEVRKQYYKKISNKFAVLENLNDDEDINRAWENIKENIKISAKQSRGLYELK